jgi:hypothetical protein
VPRIPRHRLPALAGRTDAVHGQARQAAPQPPARQRPSNSGQRRVRRWPLFVIASPAMVAIWSGWVSLGEMCGFGLVEPFPGIAAWRLNTAITLPVGVEAYGAYAMSAWLSATTPGNARAFAKWSALGSLALGMLGQVGYHLLSAAHRTRAPWPVIAAVACLPVITLGFGAALAHLLHADDTAPAADQTSKEAPRNPEKEDEEVEKPTVLPAAMVQQARALDAEHRAAHWGKPISRDNLKLRLSVATDTATALIHIVRAEHDQAAVTDSDDELPHAA